MKRPLARTAGLFGVFFLALSGPALLLLPEKVLPYPFVVEEGYKIFLVWVAVRLSGRLAAETALVLGGLFGLAELGLYAGSVYGQNFSLIVQKAAVVMAVHPLTAAVYATAMRKGKRVLTAAAGGGMLFHWLVNRSMF